MSDAEAKRKCIVCQRRELDATQEQTCVTCLGRVRRNLIHIETLYVTLPIEAVGREGSSGSIMASSSRGSDESLPGGDALVMHGPGSDGKAAAMASLHELDDSHTVDDLHSDPPAVLAKLASWEDDWRVVRGENPGPRATLSGVIIFLTRRLSWAAQNHDAFDEFAKDINQLLNALKAVLRAGMPVDRGVPCISVECGGQIVRRYARRRNCECGPRPAWIQPELPDPPKPKPIGWSLVVNKIIEENAIENRRRLLKWEVKHTKCDQGGQWNSWVCQECKRFYSPEDYNRAVADSWDNKRKREQESA